MHRYYDLTARVAILIALVVRLECADQYPLVFGPQGQPQQIAIGDTLFTQPTSGLFSAIPSASSNNLAQIYWATDQNLIYRSNGTSWVPMAVGGSGTVSSVGLALPGIFSVSGSPVTSAGTLSAALTTQSANAVWAGPTSGGAAQPTFRLLISSDIPALPYDASGAAAAVLASSLQKASNLSDLASASTARTNLGLGTSAVQNVGFFLQAANNLSDVANAATARANIGAGTGSGSVTSVAATVPAFLSISGSPITTTGTLAIGLSGTALPVANGGSGVTSTTAYALLAGGTTTTGPLQSLASVGTSGQILTSNGAAALPTWQAAPATGVTSVGLSLPGIFSVSGSPVTTTGTLTGTLATQSANQVWAGPTTGSAAAPTFRALVAADLPATYLIASNNLSDVGSASTSRTNLGLGTAATHATGDFLQSANNLSDLASSKTARANIGIDSYHAVADAAYSIVSSDRNVTYTSLTAARTATLPTSSTLNAGKEFQLKDGAGAAASFNITLAVQSGEVMDGVTNGTLTISNNYGSLHVFTDGAGKWYSRGVSPNIQTFTSTGTWTKPPWATIVRVYCQAPGGGGGGGGAVAAVTATQVHQGGGGGGSGGISSAYITASALGTTVTVTVPAAPAGGTAVTAGPSTVTLGNNGGAAANVSFGTYVTANGGQPGNGGGLNGGGGGAGGTGATTGVTGAQGTGGISATTPTTAASAPGAGGGGSGFQANGAGTGTAGAGGNAPIAANASGGGVAGTSGSHNGGVGGTTLAGSSIPGGGGGGGLGVSGTSAVGGTGGAGGSYGAGGGGGGMGIDYTTNTGATSGAGGAAGPGIIVVTSY